MATISSETTLIDTNVLVYAFDKTSPHHATCRELRDRGASGNVDVCLAPQVLFEFFAVVTNENLVTRPASTAAALAEIDKLPASFPIATPPSDVHVRAVQLMRATGFGGRGIFDVALAATMIGSGLSKIYTYDAKRSGKIPGITVLTP